MTRLIKEDIHGISSEIKTYDKIFKSQTGFGMEQIARLAAGIKRSVKKRKTVVVPVTAGLGVIDEFSETVASILAYGGIEVNVSTKTDVAGLQEAFENGAEIVFMADDNVCGAFTLRYAICSDNGYATGIGYAAALCAAIKQVAGKEILIYGAGDVGRAAAHYLADQGAIPVICDLIAEKTVRLANEIPGARTEKAGVNLRSYLYILDASNGKEFIQEEDVTEQTLIAAPGIPLGVTTAVIKKACVIHNPLELGILTMYYDCIKKWEEAKCNEQSGKIENNTVCT